LVDLFRPDLTDDDAIVCWFRASGKIGIAQEKITQEHGRRGESHRRTGEGRRLIGLRNHTGERRREKTHRFTKSHRRTGEGSRLIGLRNHTGEQEKGADL
jgi:hypothetical protein